MTWLTVVVATFGAPSWERLALRRAVPSAEALGVPVVQVHGRTLHEARNAGLERCDTEFVCWLDGDDELEAGFDVAMASSTADLRVPAVRYVKPSGVAHEPMVPRVANHAHACVGDCFADGNWAVIGSPVAVDLAREVGGFRDWPMFEDWEFWARVWLAGATVDTVPTAIYRAHMSTGSRNRGGAGVDRTEVHRQIAADLGLHWPPKGYP